MTERQRETMGRSVVLGELRRASRRLLERVEGKPKTLSNQDPETIEKLLTEVLASIGDCGVRKADLYRMLGKQIKEQRRYTKNKAREEGPTKKQRTTKMILQKVSASKESEQKLQNQRLENLFRGKQQSQNGPEKSSQSRTSAIKLRISSALSFLS